MLLVENMHVEYDAIYDDKSIFQLSRNFMIKVTF